MKVKFLTVIWGARYIDEFARVSLPSYLSPQNLPWVAEANELEVVVLTSAEGRAHFEKQPIMARLKALCSVRYIPIDDLIAGGAYGVTLTAAYARGIMDSGSEQTNTCFVFMNSDFVLADGSLRTLVSKIAEGHPCVKTPSLRAVAETALPSLVKALSPDGFELTLKPRDLVRIVLDNLHLTVTAKTITQGLITCTSHTQIYWQVDDETLLCRHHLIFMMAVKPEVPLTPLNSYSDYGFMPELVPSRRFTLLGNSDEFFVAELQSSSSERNLVKGGQASVDTIAAELCQWTTAEHRRFAEVDVVFHSGDPGPELDRARARAEQFMTELKSKMTREPIDHVNHPYWLAGVQYWASLRFAVAHQTVVMPPELDSRDSSVGKAGDLKSAILRLYSQFIGWMRRQSRSLPDVPIWHYQWLDSCLLRVWIAEVQARSRSRTLLVCSTASPLAAALPLYFPIDVCSEAALISGVTRDATPSVPELQAIYDDILIHVLREGVAGMANTLRAAEKRLGPDGVLSVFVEHRYPELDGGNLSGELPYFADQLLPKDWINYHCRARFAGGEIKYVLRCAERGVYRFLWPVSLRRLPMTAGAALAWGLLAVMTTLNNFRMRRHQARFPAHCSSLLLSLSKRILTAQSADRTSSGSRSLRS
ncbi:MULTISPECIES: hypothetical protein [unclassified Bradyrhizobium]|uniref:hypothetical protein n=1 Tax=unclassified Bradyrhizobium TaxID=2631580 RepID=UPI002916231D|nr:MULTISPECIES: hypothetical protein [unclassified Bradyrhizobium]